MQYPGRTLSRERDLDRDAAGAAPSARPVSFNRYRRTFALRRRPWARATALRQAAADRFPYHRSDFVDFHLAHDAGAVGHSGLK